MRTTSQPPDPMHSRSIFVDYWHALYRRKFSILFATAAMGAVTYGASSAEQVVYRARASVETLRPGNTLSIQSNWDIPTRSSAWQMRRTIQKRDLLERVTEKVRALYAGVVWKPPARRFSIGAAPTFDDAVAMASSTLKVRETSAAGIVNILCDSPDAAVAAHFANLLIEEYIQESLKTRWANAQFDSAWIENQLRELRSRIHTTGGRLEQYANRSVLIEGGKNSLALEALAQLRDYAMRARSLREGFQLRYELAAQATPETLSEVAQDPALAAKEFELVQRQGERAILMHTLLPEHKEVRRLEARIDELQEAVTDGRNHLLERVLNQYAAARDQEKALAEAYDRQVLVVSGGSLESGAYGILRQEMENDFQGYESLLQQSKLGAVITAIMAPNLRVVDFAEPPRKPIKPDVRRSVLSGLINGWFVAVALILLRESVNRTLRTPGDVQRVAGVPELAAVPSAPGNPLSRWTRDGEFAEAFRQSAETILLRHTKTPVVLVSSPGRGDDKARAATGIGLALSEMDRRVLLIDGDVQTPRLHQFFNLSRGAGFADVLRGGSIESVARPTLDPRIHVLPGASGRTNVIQLLRDDGRLDALVTWARSEFDVVLMTAPPALTSAGTRLLARHADSTLLVFRANRTTRAESIAAVDQLARDGCRVLGAILIDCSRRALRLSRRDLLVARPAGSMLAAFRG